MPKNNEELKKMGFYIINDKARIMLPTGFFATGPDRLRAGVEAAKYFINRPPQTEIAEALKDYHEAISNLKIFLGVVDE